MLPHVGWALGQLLLMTRSETAALYEAFVDDVRKVAASMVTGPAVDDVVQETFARLHERLEEVSAASVRGWVRTVARNVARDLHRGRQRWVHVEVDSPEEVEEDWRTEAVVASWLPPIVDALPEPYREAVRLADLEGVPQVELARRLGLSASGAKSRVQRGRARVKAQLLACCHVEMSRGGHVLDVRVRDDARAPRSCESS